jgi:V-type H+-transporting ATPase subunit G
VKHRRRLKTTRRRRKQSTRSLRRRCVQDLYHASRAEAETLTIVQHSSGNKKAEDDAKKDTDSKVKEVEDLGNKSGSKVVEQLINAVTNADPKPPRKD